MTMRLILAAVYLSFSPWSLVTAFVNPSALSATAQSQFRKCTQTSTNNNLRSLSLRLGSDDNNGEDAFAEALGGDMASALARLDKKWELAMQGDGRQNLGGWNVLDLKEDGETSPEIAYLLEPTSGVPSCVMFFLGGAVLGQFPHISYDAFLQRVAAKMNGSVIAIPYEVRPKQISFLQDFQHVSQYGVRAKVGLDHFAIAQRAVSRMKKAVIECEDSRGYPPEIRKCKSGNDSLFPMKRCRAQPLILGQMPSDTAWEPSFTRESSETRKPNLHNSPELTRFDRVLTLLSFLPLFAFTTLVRRIGIAATGIGEELSGLGSVSYNNFGFSETISMARSFAREMQVGGPGFGARSAMPFDADALFDLAGMAVSAVGLEFTPSPLDMDRIVRTRFGSNILKKTRMFQFEDDDLDSTRGFVACLEGVGQAPSVSRLPGTHLTVSHWRRTCVPCFDDNSSHHLMDIPLMDIPHDL